MVIKIVGAAVTLAACGGMGMTWARVYEKRPRQLNSLESALQLLETEIMYGATPLPEAMERVAVRCDSEISRFFSYTARELKKMEGVTAGEAWERAVSDFYPQTAMNDSDLQILKRFGVSLGTTDREDQLKHLELARRQLKLAVSQAESESRRNVTVYKYLGFLGGLLVVLVLY